VPMLCLGRGASLAGQPGFCVLGLGLDHAFLIIRKYTGGSFHDSSKKHGATICEARAKKWRTPMHVALSVPPYLW
jgi:hypothetical protein